MIQKKTGVYEQINLRKTRLKNECKKVELKKTAEMAGERGKNGQRREGRRRSRGKKEEEEDDNDEEDDEESSCSRIAYRSVSPKATEPLILIIGYSLGSPRVPRDATVCSVYRHIYSRTCPLPFFFPFNSAHLDIRSLYLRLYRYRQRFSR